MRLAQPEQDWFSLSEGLKVFATMSSTLRILHFSPFVDFAGGNRSMTALLGAASRRGPTAACVPTEGALAEEIRSLGVTTFTSFKSQRLPKWRLRRIPGNFWGLVRAIRQFRPDLLHCHSALGNHYCKWVKMGTKIPLITHQRDNYSDDYFHSDLAAADGIIAISKWVYRSLPVVLRQRSTTILNPVELPQQPPAPRDNGRLRVGMAGRCIPEKGFDLVVEAVQKLLPANDFELHFWGLQENAFGLELLRRSEPLRDRIHMGPFRNDIEVFYREMDVVVVPSRYAEPMGRMAIEAMAWGRPVIAAAHGGLVELIEDGKTGLLFEPGNIDDLRTKITLIVEDEGLRERLGQEGRRWVANTLDPDRYAEQVERFYRQVLKERGEHS